MDHNTLQILIAMVIYMAAVIVIGIMYAKKANKLYYIQVVNDILDLKTKDREIKPFLKLKDNVQKIIVINKPISETRDENGFTVIGVVDFLLKFIK